MNALNRLKQGYQIFSQSPNKKLEVLLDDKMIAQLEAGQNPYAIIISCSDSRIEPNLIFSSGLSQLFVIRTAGNIVDKIVLGSVEYAILELKVPLIVVLGHEKCGAVKASLESFETRSIPNNFEACLINSIQPAVRTAFCNIQDSDNSQINLLNQSIKENIKLNMCNLLKSQVIKDAYENKELLIVGAKYSSNGNLEFLNNL